MDSRETLARVYLDKRPDAAAQVLESLSPASAATLLAELPARLAAPVLAAMRPHYLTACLSRLPPSFVAGVARQLPTQAAVGLLRALTATQQDAVLQQIPAHQAGAVRYLLTYSGNLVGAWTEPDVLTLDPGDTVVQARARLRETDTGDMHRLYLVDRSRQLRGSVTAIALLRARDDAVLRTLSQGRPNTVRARTSLSVAAQLSDWQQTIEMPVIGRGDEFIGVVSEDVLHRALRRARQGEDEDQAREEETGTGLVEVFQLGFQGAWQVWMDLLSMPALDDKE